MNQGDQEVIGLHLRDGTALWVTPDHRMLTDTGWYEADELVVGERLARPRRLGSFGDHQPVPPEHARLLGYLIGDGYVGGKTPVSFINVQEVLHDDVRAIADGLGCDVHRRGRDGIEAAISHRKGEKNGVIALARWAGIWGHLAPDKRIAAPFFDPDVSAEVVANLLFGIWESDGWISREQTGGLRVGFTTTSEQLAHQLHWLLLRFGIGSSVRLYDKTAQRPSLIRGRRVQGKLPIWETRITGIENVALFAEVIPLWGPRGQKLTEALADPALAKHRGSQRNYLPANQTEPVIAYLEGRGVTPQQVAQLIGECAGDPQGGFKQVLGVQRLRRDRLDRLADALDSEFLRGVLDEDLWYDQITAITPREVRATYDLEVDELHTFVANDIVVHNCAAPFKQAEFDIMYGKGISREGSLLDVGTDLGLVKKSGAWYTYEGEQLGQGRENAKQFLHDNPEIMVEVSERVREHVGIGVDPGVDADKAEGEPEADDEFTEADEEPISLDD
jgi:recombination protein RecA